MLDFGLAKALARARRSDRSAAPTIAIGARQVDVLGTAAYMSPEQARGQAVDKRTDIWAFGCVVYEMLTGRLAFAGDTVSDTIAAILEREPDWSALPAATPPGVRHVLVRCLQKDLQALGGETSATSASRSRTRTAPDRSSMGGNASPHPRAVVSEPCGLR